MRTLLVALLLALGVALASDIRIAPAADADAALASAAELVRQARATENEAERNRLMADALTALAAEPSLESWAWPREPLQSNPPDLALAQERLEAAAAALPLRATPADAPRARAVLSDVLADGRFHRRTWHDLVPGWLLPAVLILERLLELVWNIVRWPFDRLLDLLGSLLSSPWMVPLGLLAVIGIVLLYRAAVRSTLVRQAEITAPPGLRALTAAEALTAAQREATLGHYRDASHYVLLSTLLWVQEHDAAHFDPSATNREHLRRAQSAARPAVAQALAPLVTAYDHLWYGAGAVTESDYRGLLDLAARVREAAA